MVKIKNLMVFTAFTMMSQSASAYIDPGTGSVIAGSMWPLIAAVVSTVLAFLVRIFWNPIKGFFQRIK